MIWSGKSLTKWRWKMYLAAFVVNLLYMSTGCVLTWPSPALRMLKAMGYTDQHNSWLASLMALGAAAGSASIGLVTACFGRKGTLYFNSGVFALSWTFLCFPQVFAVLCTGRFLSGYAMATTFNIIPVYLTEISQDDVRQAMTTTVEFFIGIGFILEYTFGSFLNYHQLQIASLLVVLVFLVPFVCMPESPFYLVSIGKHDEALQVLSWLWSQDVQPKEEILKIQRILSTQESEDKTARKTDLFTKRGYRRAFFVVFFIIFSQQFTGINVIEGYFEIILKLAGLPLSPSSAAVALAAVYAVTSCAAPPLVRQFGTKTVFVSSIFLIALCQGVFAAYMLLKQLGHVVSGGYLIPVFSFVVYNAAFAIGSGPLPWSILAELTPAEHRGLVTCVSSTATWLLCSLLLRSFYPAMQAFGVAAVFFFFSLFLAVTGVIVVIILPDTKAMSLLQVKNHLLDGKPTEDCKTVQSSQIKSNGPK